jgi:DNA (cytosine-5)-methyltransferase 1
LKYLSVCAGIEAATVAWHGLGWQPVAFSEIEKFPSQVLAHHYPDVVNVGDMTKYKEWDIERPNLLVGGTPCQSFSVAGLRKGLDDPRGNLALVYCGILDHFQPKWFVWENVPGVLSSNGGRDFGSFLGALVKLGYGFAYRVLDAQYFGVAQRRRRVFVVGCLGDWRSAAAVLFERNGLCRDIAPSREKREETARCLTTGIGTRYDGESDTFITYEWHNQDSRVKEVDVAATLNCNAGGREGHLVQAIPIQEAGGRSQTSVDNTRYNIGIGEEGDPMYCLTKSSAQRHGIAQPIAFHVDAMPDQMNFSTETSATLTTSQHAGIAQQTAVRRLTPVECERLQGFPDNYTNIKEKCPDGPRYKALGNSMAVPVMRWIGQRIQAVNDQR